MVGLFDCVQRDRIAEQFEAFNAQHPEVYREFVKYALDLRRSTIRKGKDYGSARDVLGRVRWETACNPMFWARGEFKVNNDFAAIMARRAMKEHPEIKGFFKLRKRKSLGDAPRIASESKGLA